MKKSSLTIFLITVGLASLSLEAKVVDRIIAVVNDDVITQYDLDRAMAIRLTEFKGQQKAKTEGLEKELLTSLINQKLLEQEIEKAKVQVEDEELARAVARVLSENGITIDVLRQELTKKGIRFEEFKEQLSKEIRQVKFIQQTVAPNVEVSDQDVENFKADQKMTGTELQKVNLSWIFIPLEGKSDAKDLKELVGQGMKIAEKGRRGNFDRLLTKYSKKYKGSFDGKGKEMSVKELPSNIAIQVRKMVVGGISDPIVSPEGIYIVKLFEKMATQEEKRDDVKNTEGASVSNETEIRQLLYNERMQQEIQNYLLRLRKKAFIEIRS